jgi:hypothetical protein
MLRAIEATLAAIYVNLTGQAAMKRQIKTVNDGNYIWNVDI